MTINTRRPKPSHKNLLDCPNIGTNMIEATREYAQLTNRFLQSTSPIELLLQFGPHLLGHAITASHALGDNRKPAYDSKKRLGFLEFLDYKYPYESVVNRYTVQFNKVYELILYYHAYRNNKNIDVQLVDVSNSAHKNVKGREVEVINKQARKSILTLCILKRECPTLGLRVLLAKMDTP
jgi:hypothetical protein